MARNMAAVEEDFCIPNVIAGKDGCLIPMVNLCNVSPDQTTKLYKCHKVFKTINASIISGYDHTIYDVVCGAPRVIP